MQRKNNILKSSRNGIAMIMAITVILIVATIMALSIAMTAQTTKRTTDIYIYEQAVLLSKSATEYALLKIADDGPCSNINTLNFTQNGYYNISGIVNHWFSNGQLMQKEIFKNGLRNGDWYKYDLKGNVIMHGVYMYGEHISGDKVPVPVSSLRS